MQSNTSRLNNSKKALKTKPLVFHYYFEPITLSSTSVSSCDVEEAIESLFCLKGFQPLQHPPSIQQPSTTTPKNEQPFTILPPNNITTSKNCENPTTGKRKRCESTYSVEEVPPRKSSDKELLLDSYLEKAKQLKDLPEDEIYRRLFADFHIIRNDVINMISTKNSKPLLSMCSTRSDMTTRKNLIRMIHAVYASEEDRNELSIQFGRNLARYPVLALVITSMRPFRAVNDMSRIAKSIGLKKSSKFKQVLREKLNEKQAIVPIVDICSNNNNYNGNNYNNSNNTTTATITYEDTQSYCSWLLNLTNPVYNNCK